MLLADAADLNATQLGIFVLAAALLARLAVDLKGLFWPAKPKGDGYVTHDDLKEIRVSLEEEVRASRKRVHGIGNALQKYQIKVERMHRTLLAQIQKATQPITDELIRLRTIIEEGRDAR